LYPDRFLQIPLILPPPKEQEQLAAKIAEETRQTDHAIARAQREINLLREYRTRLISDVVTGKLDARGVELPAIHERETLEETDTVEDIEADKMSDGGEAADGDE